ncbi:MAG: pirin family protein [Deltaproteobacteria bacterium]
MPSTRKIRKIIKSTPTVEGAGVHLRRVFGFNEVQLFDPFLLLDDFRSDTQKDYIKGFPWHPHRGIETITYAIDGRIEHGDSLGNQGVIFAGDVQWMTAGSGIIHQEMPKGDALQRMGGFQLWANLPKSQKMTMPRYRDVKAESIPLIETEGGTLIRLICGQLAGKQGPVQDIFIDPAYMDVTVPSRSEFVHATQKGHTVMAYVIDGSAAFYPQRGGLREETPGDGTVDVGGDAVVGNEKLVLYQDGDRVVVTTEKTGVRFLLISGAPLHEPIAWHGPIVMNTQAELETAFEEYRNGTFIKHAK